MRATRTAAGQSSAGAISAPEPPAGAAEVRAFPAELLGSLPVPVSFVLQGLGMSAAIVWTTEPAPSCRDGIVFDADELRALVVGVQGERLWPADLKGFCLRKLHDPSFRVNELLALGGAQPSTGAPWSLGRVLRWFDLELVSIGFATASREANAQAANAASAAA
jgi:hypothetical protein